MGWNPEVASMSEFTVMGPVVLTVNVPPFAPPDIELTPLPPSKVTEPRMSAPILSELALIVSCPPSVGADDAVPSIPLKRSEERRVGKECRCGWSTDAEQKNR